MRFYTSAFALLLCLTVLVSQTGCSNDAQSREPDEPEAGPTVPVEAALAERGAASAFFSGTASLEAEDEAQVVARTSGVVERVFVEEGDYVQAGQALAKLDDERPALELQRTQVSFAKLKRLYERNKDLYDKNLVSAEEFEQVRSDYEMEQAARELAELELAYTTVRAPISGVVSERMIKEGNMVRANDPTFHVTDLQPLRAVMHVPERELGKLQINQPAELRFDALAGHTFDGRVKLISPVVDPSSGTFRTIVEVRDDSRRIKPGMFGRINVVYDTRENTLLVPKEAVLAEDDASSLFVVRDSVAFRLPVQTGYVDGNRIEIISGVEEGDTIITTGQSNLKDSTRVEIVN